MRQIQFRQPGQAQDVIFCGQAPEPAAAAADDVVVRVEAFPVNPADLLTLRGIYPRNDPGSPTLGNEAVGTVETVGAEVTQIVPGDRVIMLTVDNWSEKRLVKASQVVRVSPETDLRQLAGLKVNPATAALLLTTGDLGPGDWFLQNAATSTVGRAAIQIAAHKGIRTINVVRHEKAAAELRALGGDAVVPDGDDLEVRVAAATAGAPVGLAADCVAGTATSRLASCLAPRGELVVYGSMSGQRAAVDPALLVFRDIRLRRFWLAQHLRRTPYHDIVNLYAETEDLMCRGLLRTAIDSTFEADAIKDAVRRAQAPGTHGKVIVTFG